jgi:CRISPR/Cas system-associated endonuclease Cas3-HD
MNEHIIYSYYEENPSSLLKEKLIDHISECLSAIYNFRNSKIYGYLMKMPCKWSIEPSDAIRLSIVFHDAGKIFYQKNYEYDEKRNVNHLSFKGHEFLSFYIFKKFLFNFTESNAETSILSACNFSILFHHHAMNTQQRRKVRVTCNMTLEELQINELRNVLAKFLKSNRELKALDYALNQTIEEIKASHDVKIFVENITYTSLKSSEYRKMWDEFVKNPTFRKISLALLTTLLAADYFSARKLRGGRGPSDFHIVLMDFHNYYLS